MVACELVLKLDEATCLGTILKSHLTLKRQTENPKVIETSSGQPKFQSGNVLINRILGTRFCEARTLEYALTHKETQKTMLLPALLG